MLRNQKRVLRYLAQFRQPKSSIRHMATANMHLSELWSNSTVDINSTIINGH